MNYQRDKLKKMLLECKKHLDRLKKAHQKIKAHFPLALDTYKELSDDTVAYLDQFLFRFSKLQDTLSQKVFPLLLINLGEEIKRMPFIDRLNRLEELEFLKADEWLELREIRNLLTHEYPLEEQDIIEDLNEIVNRYVKLEDIFNAIYRFCEKKLNESTIIRVACKK